MERDFSIGNLKFKLNKMDAFKQFHVVRRLAPILGDLMPVAARLSKLGDKADESAQFESLTPIMNGLAKLSDADANLVLLGLLGCVEMQQSTGNWAFIARDNMLMFQDLELPVMLQIAGRAFMYNMQSFFAALPRVSQSGG